jgi:uncharacterized damage-inducible protein DinB
MQNRFRGAVLALALITVFAALPVLPASAQEAEKATFASDVASNMEAVGKKMVALAEATPENMFGWRPTKDVRTVSEVFMHTVATNLLILPGLGAPMDEGIEVPEQGVFALFQKWEAEVTEKEDVIKWLKKSFAYAAAHVGDIEDLEAESKLFGFPATKRSYVLIMLSHAHEHLGQSIAYTRTMGGVPPWSQPAPPPPADDDDE